MIPESIAKAFREHETLRGSDYHGPTRTVAWKFFIAGWHARKLAELKRIHGLGGPMEKLTHGDFVRFLALDAISKAPPPATSDAERFEVRRQRNHLAVDIIHDAIKES